jgi:hypothetical protein
VTDDAVVAERFVATGEGFAVERMEATDEGVLVEGAVATEAEAAPEEEADEGEGKPAEA